MCESRNWISAKSREATTSFRLLGHLGRRPVATGIGGFLLVSPLTPMARTRGANLVSFVLILHIIFLFGLLPRPFYDGEAKVEEDAKRLDKLVSIQSCPSFAFGR